MAIQTLQQDAGGMKSESALPTSAMVGDVLPDEQNAGQSWLNRRFQGLEPEDFGNVIFFCLPPLSPPPGFEGIWRTNLCEPDSPELLNVEAMVCLCDTSSQSQVQTLCQYIQMIDGIGANVAPILCASHTRGERVAVSSAKQVDEIRQAHALHTRLFELGLDGMLVGEKEGFRLAFEVRAKLKKLASLSDVLSDILHERSKRTRYCKLLLECTSSIIWDYFRERIAPAIPLRDPDIPADARSLDNWKFGRDLGRDLGRGVVGSVYEIHPMGSSRIQGQPKQVMKVVAKSAVGDIQELKRFRRHIEVLNMISSDEWAHPNVIRFYQCYHSNTHLFFRMESGGDENLYQRLSHRQKSGGDHRPLYADRCFDLINQTLSAIAHLHTGPRVCHRDIKPENICVADVEGKPLQAKIADFDLSLVEVPGATCWTSCGTVPFVAPEVFLEKGYSGVTADVWSLGIVIIEILCGLRVVEHELGIRSAGRTSKAERSMGDRLREVFLAPGSAAKLVEREYRSELLPMKQAATLLVDNMVQVETHLRWTSPMARDAFSESSICTN